MLLSYIIFIGFFVISTILAPLVSTTSMRNKSPKIKIECRETLRTSFRAGLGFHVSGLYHKVFFSADYNSLMSFEMTRIDREIIFQ